MKIIDKDYSVVRSQEFQEAPFTIKESGLAHIFGILRDSLYSNKPLAVCREYMSNAYDAHVLAGIEDVPFDVHVPTSLNLYFKVRDYGKGLDYKGITDIFVSYGESTKRDSNNFVGGFGIGCKAGFAYTDSFTVISYYQGKKTSYQCYIDETKVGKIVTLGSVDSNEKTGLEIIVPVKLEHINLFVNEVKRLVPFYKVKPNIIGLKDKIEPFSYTVYSLNNFGITDSYTPHSISPYQKPGGNDTHYAIIGNVGYVIDSHLVYGTPKWGHTHPKNLHLFFDIGDLDVSASRESLQYTKKTIEAINQKFLQAKELFNQMEQDELGKVNTFWEAQLHCCKYYHTSAHRLFDKTTLKWKEYELNPKYLTIDSNLSKKLKLELYFKRGTIIKIHENITQIAFYSQKIDDKTVRKLQPIFIKETSKAREFARKIKYYLVSNSLSEAAVICGDDQSLLKEFKDKYNFLEFKTVDDLPFPPKTESKEKKEVDKTKVFELDTSVSEYNSYSEHWKPIEVDLANFEGYFVEINKFAICHKEARLKPQFLCYVTKTLKKFASFTKFTFDIDTNKPIIGIKTSEIKKLGPKATSYVEKLINELDRYYNSSLYKETIDYSDASMQFLGKANQFNLSSFRDESVFKHLMANAEVIIENRNFSVDVDKIRYNQFGILDVMKPEIKSENNWNFVCHYPMLDFINFYYVTLGGKIVKEITDYVNLVDEKKEKEKEK